MSKKDHPRIAQMHADEIGSARNYLRQSAPTADSFFPPGPESRPTTCACEDTNPQCAGLLNLGYTTKDVRERVAVQYPTARPGKPSFRIVLEEAAIIAVRTGQLNEENRSLDFRMRPEQEAALEKAAALSRSDIGLINPI